MSSFLTRWGFCLQTPIALSPNFAHPWKLSAGSRAKYRWLQLWRVVLSSAVQLLSLFITVLLLLSVYRPLCLRLWVPTIGLTFGRNDVWSILTLSVGRYQKPRSQVKVYGCSWEKFTGAKTFSVLRPPTVAEACAIEHEREYEYRWCRVQLLC